MALEGRVKLLYETLRWLDESGKTYQEAVAEAAANLDRLLALEGMCVETTLREPNGRRKRKRGRPRKSKTLAEVFAAEEAASAEPVTEA